MTCHRFHGGPDAAPLDTDATIRIGPKRRQVSAPKMASSAEAMLSLMVEEF
ncbi:MAG TPA: hypothetical protein VLL54_16885 [Pyrinomonadaceae bacterium]|nr:hypothetical protein [Pyrinomonadaceae bacterium]